MRYEDFEACFLKTGLKSVESGIELDCADHSNCLACLKIALKSCEKVGGVDGDIDEDVKSFYLCYIDRDEAAVGIVN